MAVKRGLVVVIGLQAEAVDCKSAIWGYLLPLLLLRGGSVIGDGMGHHRTNCRGSPNPYYLKAPNPSKMQGQQNKQAERVGKEVLYTRTLHYNT